MKVKYVRVFTWNVFDRIKEGVEVNCLDRRTREVNIMNNVSVESLVRILKEAEKEENSDRYEFYYIEKVKEEKNEVS
jgi:hypothetical protein